MTEREAHSLSRNPLVLRLLDLALEEDLALGDATTDALVPSHLQASGKFLAKTEGVLAGLWVAETVFHRVDPTIVVQPRLTDGARLQPGDVIASVSGPLAGMLKAERTALNLLQRMSGIATATRQYVDAVASAKARILDTRKTAPGLRLLDKEAVRTGGGHNHRTNLGDGVLIKDNHIDALRKTEGLTVAQVVRRARQHAHHLLKVQVEVRTVSEAREALEAGAEALLLDNMKPEAMRQVVAMVGGRIPLEASGGITLATVRQVAETGVDFISVGALTHSVKGLDISLEIAAQ